MRSCKRLVKTACRASPGRSINTVFVRRVGVSSASFTTWLRHHKLVLAMKMFGFNLLAKRILVGVAGQTSSAPLRSELALQVTIRTLCVSGPPKQLETSQMFNLRTPSASATAGSMAPPTASATSHCFSLHLLCSLIQPQQPELRQQRHICGTLLYFVGYQEKLLSAALPDIISGKQQFSDVSSRELASSVS